MQHRIILPGATTLTRLISEVREKATLRLWNKLALIPSAEQRSQLEMLLGPTDCSRLSLLESLKKGPVTISGPAFNETIERWKTLNDFGLHAENLSTLPAVRLKNLARYAGMTSVFNIAGCHRRKGWRFWLPLSLHGKRWRWMMHWTFWTPCWPLSSVTPERLGRKTAPLAEGSG